MQVKRFQHIFQDESRVGCNEWTRILKIWLLQFVVTFFSYRLFLVKFIYIKLCRINFSGGGVKFDFQIDDSKWISKYVSKK